MVRSRQLALSHDTHDSLLGRLLRPDLAGGSCFDFHQEKVLFRVPRCWWVFLLLVYHLVTVLPCRLGEAALSRVLLFKVVDAILLLGLHLLCQSPMRLQMTREDAD